MALLSSCYKMIIFSVVVLFTITPSSSADLFNVICSGTLEPPTCLEVIKTIPGAGEAADLKSLAGVVIPFAISDGEKTTNYVKSLANSETNPKLKEAYNSCLEWYEDGVEQMQDAGEFLKSGDYPSIGVRATGGMTAVDSCDGGLKKLQVAPDLPKKNVYFKTLSIILLRTANKLAGIGPP